MTDPTPAPEPTPDPAADPTPDPTPAAEPQTFTQDQLDRIVRDRLARQKAQFGDYDDLKAKAGKFDDLEAASKSELEKAMERATQFEQQAKDAAARAQEALLRSAVVAEAARKNVVDPDAAFTLLDRAGLEFADDGTPTNVAEAMDSLLQAKPYLAGSTRAHGADLGARDGGSGAPVQVTAEQLRRMSPEEVKKAEQEGRLTKLMTGS